MKNVLLFLLSLVLIASAVEAKIVKDNVYQIPKTTVAPVIDGMQDNVWKSIDWNMQRWYNVGDPPTETSAADSGAGLSGMSKAMWDENNLYILVYTIDDVIVDIPSNAGWNQDAVELYFDGSNNHTTETSLAAGQYQFTIPHYLMGHEATNHATAFGTALDSTGVEFKIRDVSDAEGFPGFMLEVKIPLANLGVDGASAANQLVGWEIQQDESDDATVGRASMSKWWSNSNNSWANAGIWGTAILADRVVDTVLAISKLPSCTSITVDGVLDPIYRQANIVTTNLFRVGDPPAADAVNTDPLVGALITAFPVYDENNVYVFCDIVDQVLVDIPSNAGWNQDAVELYFDGTNNHATETSLSAGQYQFTIPHYLMGHEATNHATAFGTALDSTGVEFKIVDREMRGNDGVLTEEGGGWNLEVKIPLANLGIDGTSAGAPLGFEVQMDNSNDATVGRGGMQKWWSESNNSWANAGIWGYAKLGPAIVTGVKAKPASVVSGYRLDQNYPNPFNPSTKITFELAKSEKVKLAVYNLLGEEVAVLVSGIRNAGSQTITFDAKEFSSGVYFYKLEAGSTVITKKMMLLK